LGAVAGACSPHSPSLSRDGLVDLQREHRQHRALLWRAERYLPAGKARLDRPEKTDVDVTRRETSLYGRARRINPRR